MAPDYLTTNPFASADPALSLDWSGPIYHGNQFATFSEMAKCERFSSRRGPARTKHVLVLIFGTMKNGTGATLIHCRQGSRRDCNHLQVEGFEFAALVHKEGDPDHQLEAMAADLAGLAVRELIRRRLGW